MFTEIVEETGKVQTITGSKTVIECHEDLENTEVGNLVNIEVDIPAKYIEKIRQRKNILISYENNDQETF